MKINRKIHLGLIVAVGLALLIESGIFNVLVAFLLVGAIPGTTYSIPPAFMLLLIIAVSWALLFRFAAIETFYSVVTKRGTKTAAERKKRMPSRRYHRI